MVYIKNLLFFKIILDLKLSLGVIMIITSNDKYFNLSRRDYL